MCVYVYKSTARSSLPPRLQVPNDIQTNVGVHKEMSPIINSRPDGLRCRPVTSRRVASVFEWLKHLNSGWQEGGRNE